MIANEELKQISSALARALEIAKDNETLNRYIELMKEKNYGDSTLLNAQNCVLYAGGLLDENMFSNVPNKYEKYKKFRLEVEFDINFTYLDYMLIKNAMLDISNYLFERDKRKGANNLKIYQENYNFCKKILISKYNEANGIK